MAKVVGVRFKKAGKVYYFDPSDVYPEVGSDVIVETARGLECGTVVIGPREVPDDQIVSPLKQVIREATPEDLEKLGENKGREKEAFEICSKKIAEHDLPMNLVDVEYTFDNNKIIFYFTAEGRVDFRELVRDLASVFRTRIELRQIGVRDEAKILGGLGPCGREVCCSCHLGEFAPVSIKMAKEQNLSLNPTKISGLCGRLMCCLRYETDHYEETKATLPSEGDFVVTVEGKGRVQSVNVLKNSVSVSLETGTTMDFPMEEVEPQRQAARRDSRDTQKGQSGNDAREQGRDRSREDRPREDGSRDGSAQSGEDNARAPKGENASGSGKGSGGGD